MLRKIIEKFQDRIDLPIEVDEIRDELVRLGVQDRIILSGEELDTGKLRGAFYQWREAPGVYGDTNWVTLIVYPAGEDKAWQRLICVKEMIHICDAPGVRAQDDHAVMALASKVVGPFETSEPDNTDVIAALDKLAQYQGVNLLFPQAARELARARIASGQKTVGEIADWAALPLNQVQMALEPKWDDLTTILTAVGNGGNLGGE